MSWKAVFNIVIIVITIVIVIVIVVVVTISISIISCYSLDAGESVPATATACSSISSRPASQQ